MSLDDARLRRELAALAAEFAASLAVTPRDAATTSVRLPHPFSNMSRAEWTDAVRLWRAGGVRLLAELPPRTCPACGVADARALFTSYDGYPYSECAECGTWFVPLRVTGALFERYFEITPAARRYGDYTQIQNDDASVQALDRARFAAYFADLRACLDRPLATLLDIGCGVGNSLAVARELGIDAYGLEVNARAIAAARAAGRAVFEPGAPLPRPAFDVVTLWETIEHLDDPLATLQHAKTLLAPHGLLAITAPNLDSPAIRSMRGDSMQIHGGPAWPGHMNLFTPKTLTTLLGRAGFRAIDVRGQYSANVYELAAYQFGTWTGAHAYLDGADDQVVLSQASKTWLDALAPAFSYAEEAFAFAPIMRVLAVRAEDAAPRSVAAYQDAERRRSIERLLAVCGRSGDAYAERRGRTVSFAPPAYVDPIVQMRDGGALRIDGVPTAPFAYLWKSQPMELGAGDLVRARGRLYGGGISFGLQADDRWVDTRVREAPGAFEIAVRASMPGRHAIVIANHNEQATPTNVDLDAIECVPSGSSP